MTTEKKEDRSIWEQLRTDGKFDQERGSRILPALRLGAGKEPGTVPAMWPYYTQLCAEGYMSTQLAAEHLCLVAYGRHQQGNPNSVHQPQHSFGSALNQLRNSDKFSQEALDARVSKLVTADQLDELSRHLLTLISQIRACKVPITFDYTRLRYDLVRLIDDHDSGRVRRQWGAAYFHTTTPAKKG